MDSFEERLAEAVRKYENLYNTSSKSYKDLQMVNNSWKEVALAVNAEEEVCRKRWRYLRDRFAKAKRRVSKKRSADPAGRKSVPALFTSLLWLDKHVKHRETTTMLQTEKRRKAVVNAVPTPQNVPSCNAGPPAVCPESIRPVSMTLPSNNSTMRSTSGCPSRGREQGPEESNNQVDERSQQFLVLQQQLRPEGDKERDAFAEWLRSAMHNFEHTIWRRCQRELTDVMYRFIAENDALRDGGQGRLQIEEIEYKWQPK
ncbi:PREDICTED: uncharacterized protein LOC107096748 [Cyprinodon variegatus]|uniref:uncharacterized protein LOC107096748 n=1 Tax=Cyprinodon variegatus TaxID=28743 RepID=UPI0007428B87|nr:PREDICTED: uncharacterized protein LOC107096748 [Cyprinodon variegatus]